ncbi:MAG: 3-alpha domain-containing protein [Blastocatellales bacterium]
MARASRHPALPKGWREHFQKQIEK